MKRCLPFMLAIVYIVRFDWTGKVASWDSEKDFTIETLHTTPGTVFSSEQSAMDYIQEQRSRWNDEGFCSWMIYKVIEVRGGRAPTGGKR